MVSELSNNLSKQRVPVFDVLKGIGISLVVLGHVTHHSNLGTWIYAFHMPLFFLVAGFFYRPKENYWWKQFKSLMIPYFVFALLSFAYWFFIESKFRPVKSGVDVMVQFSNIFYPMNMVEKPGPHLFNVVLWFLPCLFVTSLFAHFFLLLVKKTWVVLASLVAIVVADSFFKVQMPFYLTQMCFAAPFFLLGNCMGQYKEAVYAKVGSCSPWWAVLAVIPSVLVWLYAGRGSMRSNIYPDSYAVYFVVAVILVITAFYFSALLKDNKVLEWLGVNSLALMVVHEPIKRVVIFAFTKVAHIEATVVRDSIPLCVVIAVIVIILCVPLVLLINKYGRFLLGKF